MMANKYHPKHIDMDVEERVSLQIKYLIF